jgi:RNA polymerase-interacting CarD/CdnL/TRCF family regulator
VGVFPGTRKPPAHRGDEQRVATAKTRTAHAALRTISSHHDLHVAFQILEELASSRTRRRSSRYMNSEEHGPNLHD